ncbi:hypothetical protein EDB89DRAFT_1151070 [Lactarius sanguifluus]|nr:hypothetical protein EDB89DRAFT_1151070 [Lactarius sanguifluus]
MVKLIHAKNGLSISKSTHAGRPFAAQTARAHGASVSGTKALGGWSESGSFRPCYDRAFPTDALLGAAMFNAQQLDAHFQPRAALEPPAELLAAVFPWVEQEQDKLAQRQAASGSQSADIALKQFLRLLVWLRRVLLQDCAILFAKYPSCAMFRYPPFNDPAFRQFASSAQSAVDQAEEEVRHAFKDLPERVAATFRGLATDIKMDQRSQRTDTEFRWDALDSRLDQLTALLQVLVGSKSFKGNCKANKVLRALQSTASDPHDTFQAISGTSSPRPFATSPVATSPNITINISSPSTGTPTSSLTCAVTQPTQPLMGSAHSNLAHSSTQQQCHIPLYQGQPMTPPQLAKWNSLIVKYGEARVHKHEWDWVQGNFLPIYIYQSVNRLTDYWTEWMRGIGGHLSTRELTEAWGAKWRRNNGTLKTECSRRKKVIDLVTALSAKPNWDVCLALRFLEKYEALYSPRKFCDWLNAENMQAVLVSAATYCR